MKKILVIFTHTLIITLSYINFVFAQPELEKDTLRQKIETVVQKLNMKILLDDKQAEKIKKILISEFKTVSYKSDKNERINSINQQVEKILSSRQRNKFLILKSSWLDNLFDDETEINSKNQ